MTNRCTGKGEKSSGEFLGRLPVESRRLALDPYAMHRAFPEIWREYLIEHFGGERWQIMQYFSVDERTARAWLACQNQPRAEKLALALQRNPELYIAIRDAA